MELHTSQNFVRKSNEFEETGFKINASSMTFKLLSDGLYSNKVQAIIRELSCNAIDSHLAAGNENTPFILHLPDVDDPTFRIRDFGTGLSKEDIFTVYSTYFESTKRNSNNFVGCLGLGSKTPFSYTDNFNVTSFFEGRKYTYSSYISSNGTPTIALLFEEPSDEHNGLQISFAVNPKDFSTFTHEAKKVFKWFDILPAFEGTRLSIERPSFSTEYDGFSVFSQRGYLVNEQYIVHSHGVLMGNVFYSLNVSALESFISKPLLSILNCGHQFLLKFPIGSVSIHPSREYLSYDKLTIRAIEKRLEEIEKQIQSYIDESIKDCECAWDAVLELKKCSQYQNYIDAALKDKTLKFKGKILSPQYTFPKNLYGSKFTFKYQRSGTYSTSHFPSYRLEKKTVSENTIFVIVDPKNDKTYTIEKFRSWMRNDPCADYEKEYIVFSDDDIKEAQDFINNLGILKGVHWHYWHDIPKPPKKQRSGSGGYGVKKTQAKRITAYGNWSDHKEVDLKNGKGVYVYRIKDKVDGYLNAWNNSSFMSRVSHICHQYSKFNNGEFISIYGFTDRQLKSLGSGWIEFKTWLMLEIDKLETDPNFIAKTVDFNDGKNAGIFSEDGAFEKFSIKKLESFQKIIEAAEKLGIQLPAAGSAVTKIINGNQAFESFAEHREYLISLHSAINGIDFDARAEFDKFIANHKRRTGTNQYLDAVKEIDKFYTKYPLLKTFVFNDVIIADQAAEELAFYIKGRQ